MFRCRPWDELITHPRSPAVCKMIMKLKSRGPVEPVKKELSTGANLSQNFIRTIDYLDWNFLSFSSAPPDKCLEQATIASFQILYNSLFMYHLTNPRTQRLWHQFVRTDIFTTCKPNIRSAYKVLVGNSEGRMCVDWIQLAQMNTSGRLLCTSQWIFEFCKKQRISWPAGQLSSSISVRI
jgi:hypothetical protein